MQPEIRSEKKLSDDQLCHLEYILKDNNVYAWQEAGQIHPVVIIYNFRAASGMYQDLLKEIEL